MPIIEGCKKRVLSTGEVTKLRYGLEGAPVMKKPKFDNSSQHAPLEFSKSSSRRVKRHEHVEQGKVVAKTAGKKRTCDTL
jgi:hypothetical protein